MKMPSSGQRSGCRTDQPPAGIACSIRLGRGPPYGSWLIYPVFKVRAGRLPREGGSASRPAPAWRRGSATSLLDHLVVGLFAQHVHGASVPNDLRSALATRVRPTFSNRASISERLTPSARINARVPESASNSLRVGSYFRQIVIFALFLISLRYAARLMFNRAQVKRPRSQRPPRISRRGRARALQHRHRGSFPRDRPPACRSRRESPACA
jgi:hypothetical protein